MQEQQLVDLLKRTELFAGFAERTLHELARVCPQLTLRAGQVLFDHGSLGASMYVVLDGRLRVARDQRVLTLLGPAEYLGELSLIEPGPRSASVSAVEPTTLLEITQPIFDAHVASNGPAMHAMSRYVGRTLRRLTDATHAAYEHVNMLIHDMRNLLCVQELLAIVAETLPDETARAHLEHVLRTRDMLDTMMLGALKRARGLDEPYRKAPVQLDAVVRNCLADLAMHPDVRRVAVVLEVADAIPSIVGNAIDLQRAVANLVINAAQASAPGAPVRVYVGSRGDRVVVDVADQGVGISPDVLPHVFEFNFTTKPQGSGLGLASCREIIERLHGGRLTCTSVVGAGSTFTCELPV
jgi:signal transduction histidine kinase